MAGVMMLAIAGVAMGWYGASMLMPEGTVATTAVESSAAAPVIGTAPSEPLQTTAPAGPATTSPDRVASESVRDATPGSAAGPETPGAAVADADSRLHPMAPDAGGRTGRPEQADDGDILDMIDRWRSALLSNNSERIAPFYASRVDRYFLRANVDRGFVRRYMETEESRGSRLTAYSLGQIAMERQNDGTVELRFVADFSVSTPSGNRSGHARTTLRLRKEDGDWKIFSERDFKF